MAGKSSPPPTILREHTKFRGRWIIRPCTRWLSEIPRISALPFVLSGGRRQGVFSLAVSRDIPAVATSTASVLAFRSLGRLGRYSRIFATGVFAMMRAGQPPRIPRRVPLASLVVDFSSVAWLIDELDDMDWSGYTTEYTTSAEYPSIRAHSRAGPTVE